MDYLAIRADRHCKSGPEVSASDPVWFWGLHAAWPCVHIPSQWLHESNFDMGAFGNRLHALSHYPHELLFPQVGKFEEGSISISSFSYHLAQSRLYLIKIRKFGENNLLKSTKLAKQGNSARTWQASLHLDWVESLKAVYPENLTSKVLQYAYNRAADGNISSTAD